MCFRHSKFVLNFVIRINLITDISVGRVAIGRPCRDDHCEDRYERTETDVNASG